MTNDAVEFTVERSARIKSTSAQSRPERQAEGTPGLEQADRNDFPDRVRRKYYVVAAKAGPEGEAIHARVYTDRQGEYLAFKDAGDRLSTRNGAPGIVRDMIAVAEHRGWEAVSVRGPVEFRREAWLEATARGLPVRGFEPAELDQETLRKRLVDRIPQRGDLIRPAPDLDASSTMKGAGPSARANLDVGVTGRLVAVGRASYPGRERAEPSGYVDLDLADGSSRRIWGAALPKAVEAANVGVGDGVRIQRDGVERVAKDVRAVDGRTGKTSVERQDVVRNRWTVTAEQFRFLDRREAVRDPALAAAHSNVAVLERALKARFPQDERAWQIMLDAARERVAEHLERGQTFRRAEIRVAERTAAREAVEPASRVNHRQEKRLQTRDRGRDR